MLPTLYEYYTSGGIKTGLSANGLCFTLNEKIITIYSGAMHYFRVHPDYWRDRLRKIRAAGLNTVETYVPWNLHEPIPGVYDFGNGDSDFEQFLDIEKFIKIAQDEDLFVIVRPGPYICAEWEFGGLPSWLLRNQKMNIRTSDEAFMNYVSAYFSKLFEILSKLQFTKGGSIIAFQIENEYGNTKKKDKPIDTDYLIQLKNIFTKNGLVELFFTSDTPSNGNFGSLPDVLNTANFQSDPEKELSLLQSYQPEKPLMVMEYWTGWFDHWAEQHHKRCNKEFSDVLERILKFPASVNMYMFHGGTNWGLLNGANIEGSSVDNGGYQPDTSSYDYDAPLNEAGDYTEKYFSVQRLIKHYNPVLTALPVLPELIERDTYNEVEITEELVFDDILKNEDFYIESQELLPMELLPITYDMGQSYGYIVYRRRNLNIPANSVLNIRGRVCDTVIVLINGKVVSKALETPEDLEGFGYWKVKDSSLEMSNEDCENATLDLVVENWGRVNYGKLDQFLQYKGIWQGHVSLNDRFLLDWEILPLDFKKSWTNSLTGWQLPRFHLGPALYKGTLKVFKRKDTYIDMRGWTKGIVIVNGFILSRYLKLGPQQAVYLPAAFLKEGDNEIVIFEHFAPDNHISFVKDQIYSSVA
ncbi:hypothetical protein RN001_005400 [Aquatica leii]|uniref:Beta-galactosidase n=1 Tax=Aquatica leii TaxID=1421715 RepID=A0AAN7PJT3_9COLE|nr:hypothetical protein RN001_005400 [Aquatica leii]